MSNKSELELLKSKDPEFLNQIVDEYTDYLYYLCRQKGFDEKQSEDLVQEVWLRFFTAIERFEGKSKIKTFILGIFFNVYKETVRTLTKDRQHDAIEDIFESQFDTKGHWAENVWPPDEGVWRQELRDSLEHCLDHIDSKYKEVFILKEVLEETTDKICKILEVSNTHLGVLLFRSRAHLKECIEGKIK